MFPNKPREDFAFPIKLGELSWRGNKFGLGDWLNGDTETALVLIARDSSILTCFLTGGRVRLSEGTRVWLGLLTVAAAATNVSSFAASQDICLLLQAR